VSEPAPAESVRDRFFDAAVVAGFMLIGITTVLLGSGLGGHRLARNLGNVLQIAAPASAAVACIYAGRRLGNGCSSAMCIPTLLR